MHLDEIEAIKQVKYAYFRLLDLKRFDELGELLTDDCTADYEDGTRHYDGRAAIVGFLTEVLTDPGIITMHHGHHPEISSTGLDAATGVWYLVDRVVIPGADLEIGGTAFDRDAVRPARWPVADQPHRVRSASSRSTWPTRRWR